ncbi:2982_t:CDS:2 [Entrophospora sp. SA101]|nr:908_t:CDS:2 [Entrophospora sp. SA101]CAJ0638918.1 3699_t:CDS:2 [Entrophospora sp. SA101]CAJ0756720.1 2982_t:CDS:2 [Entrophospora sp. SA101]CAJ0826251.1 17066_t:CDS:2 [Entrophospora sp. SA101]CAJ0860297.1 7457_t:CDS:2 [Entrophospora sp. SA101]
MEFLDTIINQFQNNPLNWILFSFLIYVIYLSFTPIPYQLPKVKHPETTIFKEYTPKQLREFDGRNLHTKIFLAVSGNIYDVSKGRSFYGPDGPYGNFAGRDASRGLAKNSFDLDVLTPIDQEIDKLEDLSHEELDSLNEWHDGGKFY